MSEALILGLAASHNGAACLLRGDKVLVAIQEERLRRQKRAALIPSQPFMALDYVMETAGISPSDLDLVVLAPLYAPDSDANDLSANAALAEVPRAVVSHHYAHAMGAYAQSGFRDTAICVIDAMGSRTTDLSDSERAVILGDWRAREADAVTGTEVRELVSFYRASQGVLTPVEKHVGAHQPFDPAGDHRPHMMNFIGLGVMYMAVAQQIFGHWGASGKVMGLAPFGERRFERSAFWRLEDDMLVFSDMLHQAIRYAERWPERQSLYADLAASVQAALEEGLEHLWERLARLTQAKRLCYAGGVALNGVANERLLQSARFEEVFIMPAAEDCGTAIGAAYHGLFSLRGWRKPSDTRREYFGRDYGLGVPTDETLREVCRRLEDGEAIAWFQGGSEFGPRALGHRSLLYDPRRQDAEERINRQIKCREDFRPFAPVVLAEHAGRWFDLGDAAPESPFMLRVVKVLEERRALVPAITHIDGSSRPQTLRPQQDASLHRLLSLFYERTGVPMLLNTSLNVMGEPIVETPEEAIELVRRRGIECLVLGERLVVQPR